jgi:hypothetical protein
MMTDGTTIAGFCAEIAIDAQVETLDEAHLAMQITDLWLTHREAKASARKTRDELKAVRCQIGEKLHALKAHLARTGRGGGWASFLRSNRIPRASADRYVSRHEASLHPPTNRLTEPFSEPTEEEIRGLVRRLIPKLRQMLTTVNAVDHFYDELIAQIPATGFRLVDTKS